MTASIAGLPQRFAEKIRLEPDGCWTWLASKDKDGYGYAFLDGKNRRAHRVIYELLVAPMPAELVADHLCRNPSCVNPDHLEPVTVRENTLRGDGPTARQARQTECLRGHPLDEVNTYTNPRGMRSCRICRREVKRAWKERRRQ